MVPRFFNFLQPMMAVERHQLFCITSVCVGKSRPCIGCDPLLASARIVYVRMSVSVFALCTLTVVKSIFFSYTTTKKSDGNEWWYFFTCV